MIIGFSHHGLGNSGPALDYLTGYLVNGEARDPKPEVVRGDPEATARIIDALPFKRRYSSGVLSFASEDHVTSEVQEDIMNRFENAVFAGLPSDRRNIVWVKHRDKGRTELHFVVPRVDLGTGKSLNIAPPTPASRELLDTLRSAINLRFGFSDPSDPARTQAVSIPNHVAKLEAQAARLGRSARPDIRQIITGRLLDEAVAGRIQGRTDVVAYLTRQGFSVARAGINYLTVICPGSGERVRLKGTIFREHFRPADLGPAVVRHNPAQLFQLDKRLERLVQKRANYHRARYEISDPVEVREHIGDFQNDRTREPAVAVDPNHRGRISGAGSRAGHHARRLVESSQRFSRAGHGLERAGGRLGQAHRALALDFERALARLAREQRLQNLVRHHGAVQRSRDLDHELELEISL